MKRISRLKGSGSISIVRSIPKATRLTSCSVIRTRPIPRLSKPYNKTERSRPHVRYGRWRISITSSDKIIGSLKGVQDTAWGLPLSVRLGGPSEASRDAHDPQMAAPWHQKRRYRRPKSDHCHCLWNCCVTMPISSKHFRYSEFLQHIR
jgi:hypothetical protein